MLLVLLDPVTTYADRVLAGDVVAGRPVRQAAARHLRDVSSAKARGLVWLGDEVGHLLQFFPALLRLDDGAPFVLQPAQEFIIGSLLGWYNADGSRRYRTAYVEMAKGAGKSPLGAALGLYGLLEDNEPAAEIYSAAVTRDQAGIVFRDAKNMVQQSPELSGIVDQNISNLAVLETRSFFRPVSSEHKSLDGKRVHMALVDEIHEHPSPLVVDKMRAGTKGRTRALIFEITNSGYSKTSVCWDHHQYSLQVVSDAVPNDSWFAYVASLDACEVCYAAGFMQPNGECADCDNWRDEGVWQKANPLLDVSVSRRYLREQVAEADGIPAKENLVKRLNFCLWTEQSVRWLPMDKWDACAGEVEPAALAGRSCYIGVDLSSTTDLSAVVLLFPPMVAGEPYSILPYFFTPADNVARRRERDRVDYQTWIDSGAMIATPGTVVDYDQIRGTLNELAETYDVIEVPIDRWNSTQLQTQLLGDGFEVVQFGQGFASMSAPTKRLEELVLGASLAHAGHPVLRWMASNVAVQQDAAGNIKPDRKASEEKIDGVVALVMALGRCMVQPPKTDSIYTSRGLVTI